MPLTASLKVICKSAALKDIKKVQRHASYLDVVSCLIIAPQTAHLQIPLAEAQPKFAKELSISFSYDSGNELLYLKETG